MPGEVDNSKQPKIQVLSKNLENEGNLGTKPRLEIGVGLFPYRVRRDVGSAFISSSDILTNMSNSSARERAKTH